MADTRKDRRAPISLKVRFKSATLAEFIEQYSVDISRGGIFIKSRSPMAIGTLLKFEFQLKDQSRLIHGVGRVVWTRQPTEGATEPPGMGIKFIKMGAESRKLVEQLASQRGDAPGRYDHGESSAASGSTSFFPETSDAAMPPPEDRTQVRHASEFLASALAEGGADSARDEAEQEAKVARARAEERKRQAARQQPSPNPVEPAPEAAPLPLEPPTPPSEAPQAAHHPRARSNDLEQTAVRSSEEMAALSAQMTSNRPPASPASSPEKPVEAGGAAAPSDAGLGDLGDVAPPSEVPMAADMSVDLQLETLPPEADSLTAELPDEPPAAAAPPPTPATPPTPPTRASSRSEAANEDTLEGPSPPAAPESRSKVGLVLFVVVAAAAAALLGYLQFAEEPQPADDLGAYGSAGEGSEPVRGEGGEDDAEDEPAAALAAEASAVLEGEDLAPTAAPPEAELGPPVAVRFMSWPRGAAIHIDGEERGKTPLELELPEGQAIEVRARLAGYIEPTQRLVVEAEMAPVRFALEAMPYVVRVTTEPPGALIRSVGGGLIRSTPGEIELRRRPPRPLAMMAALAGHHRAVRSIPLADFVEEDGRMVATVRIELRRRQGGRGASRADRSQASPEPDAPTVPASPSAADDAPAPPRAGETESPPSADTTPESQPEATGTPAAPPEDVAPEPSPESAAAPAPAEPSPAEPSPAEPSPAEPAPAEPAPASSGAGSGASSGAGSGANEAS